MQGSKQPEHRHHQHRQARQPQHSLRFGHTFRPAIGFVKCASHDHRKDRPHVGEHVNHCVDHADFGFTNQFRNHAVFGRAEKGALGSQQEHCQQAEPDVVEIKTNERRQHDDELRLLHAHGYQLLAVAISQLTGNGSEQKKRQHQRRGHVALAALTQSAFPNTRRRQAKGEHLFQQVIIRHTKELREDERQKTLVGKRALGFGFAHRGGTLAQAPVIREIDSEGEFIYEIDDVKTTPRPDECCAR